MLHFYRVKKGKKKNQTKALFINNWKTDFLNKHFSYFIGQNTFFISVTQKLERKKNFSFELIHWNFPPKNKDTFLILSFFLLLHFYRVKNEKLNKYIFYYCNSTGN